MSAIRKPCPSCPWRVDQHADAIPNFRLALAEGLVTTSPDFRGMGPEFGAPMFACHQSHNGGEVVCAGWLAAVGAAHLGVRLEVLAGRMDPGALQPGDDWPELHETFADVIAKLREDCRASRPACEPAQGSA